MYSRSSPQLLSSCLNELIQMIQRHARADGFHGTSVKGLQFLRSSQVMEPIHSVSGPSICVVVQGAKSTAVGAESYRYDPTTYLVTSVQLPTVGRIVHASPDSPYLSLKLTFSTDDILHVIREGEQNESKELRRGIAVSELTHALLEPFVRLVKLLDAPEDIPFIAPLIVQEILYKVMKGEQGELMRQCILVGSFANSIAKAVQRIKQHYDQPLSIEALAKEVNLSASALHKHFKKVTTMSPLQYQKTLRLQEARRLLLADTCSAAEAGFRVGYESPTQFSREYARMFEQPPIRDRNQLRESVYYDESQHG